MSFWSGERWAAQLGLEGPSVIDPASPDRIDCAAYTLAVGPEHYITPTDRSSDPQTQSIQQVQPGETFSIPAGQFALVLTEEIVTAPHNVVGFISIRSRIKMKGLVNVSGFHIDPGFIGR